MIYFSARRTKTTMALVAQEFFILLFTLVGVTHAGTGDVVVGLPGTGLGSTDQSVWMIPAGGGVPSLKVTLPPGYYSEFTPAVAFDAAGNLYYAASSASGDVTNVWLYGETTPIATFPAGSEGNFGVGPDLAIDQNGNLAIGLPGTGLGSTDQSVWMIPAGGGVPSLKVTLPPGYYSEFTPAVAFDAAGKLYYTTSSASGDVTNVWRYGETTPIATFPGGSGGFFVGPDLAINRAPQTYGILIGDTNGDDVVDAADFITMKQNFGLGSGAILAQGDFNNSGSVDWLDLQLLMGNFGATAPGVGTAPEPATLSLLALGGLALIRRRRR